jgi:23S rRNA pseudouridine2605 synthase
MKSPSPTRRLRNPDQRAGLARALSKLGYCSRSQAWMLIETGRVRLNGAVCRNPEQSVAFGRDHIEVNGQTVRATARVYLMLNKPRGLVTTTSDERNRETVYACFAGAELPFVSPVGRLDKASEGLLLFTNDTEWAARITAPESHVEKTYHVQVNCVADRTLMQKITEGARIEGEALKAKRTRLLRQGEKNSWLEVVLDEGRNRHIRRLLAALDLETLRLVRVAIGPLSLGTLGKGQWRHLTPHEIQIFQKTRAGQIVVEPRRD